MKENFLKKNWQILLINFLLLFVFLFFYGRFGDIIVDSFREAYIPTQILKGKILYKDIFTIYSPFSYLFNAFLFLVFGIKLKVLYFAGLIASAGILNLIYKLGAKFLPKLYAMGIVLFVISVCVLSPNVFNFIFPYSYGILYGILFVLGALYCAINKHFFLAYLLYSFAICSKYEFIFLILPLIWYSGFKYFWRNIIAVIIPVVICLIPLILQGLKAGDLIFPILILIGMSGAKTLHWFYSVSGLIFRPQIILIYLTEFLKLFVPAFILNRYKNKYIILLVLLYLSFILSQKSFIYLFPLILMLSIFRYKKLNKKQKFIIFSSLLVSVKVFFASTLESYGMFFIPLGILSLFILVPKQFKKSLLIIILLSSIIFGVMNSKSLMLKNYKIQTQRGIIYTSNYYGNSISQLNKFVESTKKDDKIVIYPECLAVNFLNNINSDNKLYSLIPLYVETFGENFIIQRLDFIKPKYIAITNYDTSNYGASEFGKDYALKVYDYVNKNYKKIKNINNDFSIILFERNWQK